MPFPPFWTNATPAPLAPVAAPEAVSFDVVTSAIARDFTTKATADATKAKSINDRMTAWYDANVEPDASGVSDLSAGAVLNALLGTNVNVFVVTPDTGGLDYLQRALVGAMARESDPNRPFLDEEQYTGALFMLIVGSPEVVFGASLALGALLGGNVASMQASMHRLLTESPPLEGITNGFLDLQDNAKSGLSELQGRLVNTWSNSTMGKILQDGFPAALVEAVTGARPVAVSPATCVESTGATVTISHYENRRDMVIVWDIQGTRQFIRPKILDSHTMTFALESSMTDNPGTFGIATRLPDGTIDPIANFSVTPRPATTKILDMGQGAIFDEWKALLAGSPAAELIPGSVTLPLKRPDIIGALGKDIPNAGNAISTGLADVGGYLSGRLADAGTLGLTALGLASGLAAEIANVYATTLIMPPSQGGAHQLTWAINQGFGQFAALAPVIDPGMVATGVFLVTSANTAADTAAALKTYGATLGIHGLDQL